MDKKTLLGWLRGIGAAVAAMAYAVVFTAELMGRRGTAFESFFFLAAFGGATAVAFGVCFVPSKRTACVMLGTAIYGPLVGLALMEDENRRADALLATTIGLLIAVVLCGWIIRRASPKSRR